MLNVAMMQKDKEVEDLKKQDKIKEDALIKLSNQVMILMKEMQGIKTRHYQSKKSVLKLFLNIINIYFRIFTLL